MSLYAVKNSTGAMSEHELMQACVPVHRSNSRQDNGLHAAGDSLVDFMHRFVKADGDNSGALDRREVEQAVKKLGLAPDVTAKLKQTLDDASGGSGQVTLPVWYELVGEIYETDGIVGLRRPSFAFSLRASRRCRLGGPKFITRTGRVPLTHRRPPARTGRATRATEACRNRDAARRRGRGGEAAL